MKTQAFTLAEVLLTLAIIGVVAALTIPAVITKVQQGQYVVGLRKAYNTLKSVEREAAQENGEMANWTWGGDLTDFDKYFKPHFDILKDCGSTTDDGCFVKTYLQLKGTTIEREDINTNLWSKIITSDGISFAYRADNLALKKASFIVDVNGKKGPNRAGRDLFIFYTYKNIGTKPGGSFNDNEQPADRANMDSKCVTLGQYCTSKVLSEGAMSY